MSNFSNNLFESPCVIFRPSKYFYQAVYILKLSPLVTFIKIDIAFRIALSIISNNEIIIFQ